METELQTHFQVKLQTRIRIKLELTHETITHSTWIQKYPIYLSN